LGRSRGGFGTKIHALVDALGNPIGFTLTGAEQADISQAPALLDQAPNTQAVIADKGYDADALVERIQAQHAEAIIPPRSNRKQPRDYDRHRYQARNLVERFFSRLKQFRRIATRYEKLASHFAAMVTCGCIMIWLK
jgi:transposase